MSTLLKSQKREKLGTRASRALRAEGLIPANLQADGEKPHVNLSINEEQFLATRRQHEHVYELEVDGAREAALVRELEWDTFGERIVHVEFRRVDLSKKTEVEVPLVFVGHPKGVLNQLLNELRIMTLPINIPDSFEVKVDGLEPGSTVHASDVPLPEGVDLAVEPDTGVAVISAVKAEAEPTEEAAADAEAGAGAVAEGEGDGAAPKED